jgi:hypothetical protein
LGAELPFDACAGRVALSLPCIDFGDEGCALADAAIKTFPPQGRAFGPWHDHDLLNAHEIAPGTEAAPPMHRHKHKTMPRTALLLILGSSPRVEGIPAFFGARRYGIWLIILMALVFAASTTATYVALCVVSTAGLQRVRFGASERYGEVISGAFSMLINESEPCCLHRHLPTNDARYDGQGHGTAWT